MILPSHMTLCYFRFPWFPPPISSTLSTWEAWQMSLKMLLFVPRHVLLVYYPCCVYVSNVLYVSPCPVLMNTQWYISALISIPINLPATRGKFAVGPKACSSLFWLLSLPPHQDQVKCRRWKNDASHQIKFSVLSTPLHLNVFIQIHLNVIFNSEKIKKPTKKHQIQNQSLNNLKFKPLSQKKKWELGSCFRTKFCVTRYCSSTLNQMPKSVPT